MKILIAGLGSIGRRHFRNLIALGETDLVLLRSHHSTLPDEILAGYPVETDLAAALKVHRPEAVIVANPTALHLDVAIPAAEAGCHILLEKPVADSLERVPALKAALKRGGGQVLVGFQFRSHPTLQRARELLQSGAIGKPLAAHAYWGEYLPDWHPWEDYRRGYAARADLGGGVILTLTHALDYMRYLLGEVTALWSFSGHISPLEVDVEDVAEIGLRFAGGALGGVHLNYIQRPPTHWLEIAGTGGTLRWDNADGVLHWLKIPTTFGSWGAQAAAPDIATFAPPAGFERNNLFVEQLRHFLDVARGRAVPLCTLQDGVRALDLALAAKRCALDGQMVEWS